MNISSDPPDICVRALASGSSGNCFLVESAGEAILIDCGLGSKTLLQLLKQRGLDPRRLSAILLTHEHSDHIRSLNFISTRYDVPVVTNPATLAAASALVGTLREQPVKTGEAISVGIFDIATFPVSHDATETIGFLIRCTNQTVCYLTDTGSIPETALEPLRLADLLVIEANHDEGRVRRSRYPESLKRRILSPTGHLSNKAAAEALAKTLDPARQMVWLAHLSAETNSPRLARNTVRGYLAAQGLTAARIEIAERDRPSLVWHSAQTGFQARLDL